MPRLDVRERSQARDKFHHMRPENICPCDCGAPVESIVCPEGCNQLPWTNSDIAGQDLRKQILEKP